VYYAFVRVDVAGDRDSDRFGFCVTRNGKDQLAERLQALGYTFTREGGHLMTVRHRPVVCHDCAAYVRSSEVDADDHAEDFSAFEPRKPKCERGSALRTFEAGCA
jgi:hypothetical protein